MTNFTGTYMSEYIKIISKIFPAVGMLLLKFRYLIDFLGYIMLLPCNTQKCNYYCFPSSRMYLYKACINDTPYVIGFLMNFLNNFYLGSLKIASGNGWSEGSFPGGQVESP